MDFREDLMFPALNVADQDELLATLGGAVTRVGLARDDYVAALREREQEFPTGLPVGGGVAIPHTAAEYVSGNTIAAASLAKPVVFHEMGGNEDSEVLVSTVLMLVFADASQHVPLLSQIVRRIRDQKFIESLRGAEDPAAMARVLAEAFPSAS